MLKYYTRDVKQQSIDQLVCTFIIKQKTQTRKLDEQHGPHQKSGLN